MSKMGMGRWGVLAIAGALTLGATGCGDDLAASPENTGAVQGTLLLNDGVSISEVHYRVSVKVGRGSKIIAEGTIPVAAPGTTASFFIGGIPETTQAGFVMDATSTDGSVTCHDGSTFPVAAGEVLSIEMLLQCTPVGSAPASATVSATFNYCPYLTSVFAAPLTAAIGEDINLEAVAVDRDPADTVTYKWFSSFGRGTFANPAAAATAYTCGTAGEDIVGISVIDAVHDCGSGTSFIVTCVD